MRLGTLNLAHQTRPTHVPAGLLDALVALDTDVLFVTEFVETAAWLAALRTRFAHVHTTPQRRYGANRSRFANQVAALSRWPIAPRPGLEPVPDVHAATNFLSVAIRGRVLTGLRAPTYRRAADWYGYWDHVGERLDGDVVIGDLNVDPSRTGRRDAVLPPGWRRVTPDGVSYRSPRNGTTSTIDHALIRAGIEVDHAAYRLEFFGRWGLDHCPLVVELRS